MGLLRQKEEELNMVFRRTVATTADTDLETKEETTEFSSKGSGLNTSSTSKPYESSAKDMNTVKKPYTSFLIHTLQHKKLTLLDQSISSWTDFILAKERTPLLGA